MSADWKFVVAIGFLVVFVVAGNRPRLLSRLMQVVSTVGFGLLALYGLGMTLFGRSNSILGGLLFVACAAGLAFASFHSFDRMARRYDPD
jgi:hypothetical protein